LDIPQIFSASPSGKTKRRTPNILGRNNVLAVFYHLAEFGGVGLHLPPGRPKMFIFTGSIARSAQRRYLRYTQRTILKFFAPTGATRCTDGGMKVDWRSGP